jgi:hypothetical protein
MKTHHSGIIDKKQEIKEVLKKNLPRCKEMKIICRPLQK